MRLLDGVTSKDTCTSFALTTWGAIEKLLSEGLNIAFTFLKLGEGNVHGSVTGSSLDRNLALYNKSEEIR